MFVSKKLFLISFIIAVCLNFTNVNGNTTESTPDPENDGKCRILSLRGGGVHGAWEVGVLKAMAEKMKTEDMRYDYIAGVSIGAINASILASFEKGKEVEAI